VSNSRDCANPACKKPFTPRVYNAIYCNAECRKIITNQKVLQRYYDKKARFTSRRICLTDECNAVLSRYNQEDICESCKRERLVMRLIGWGWDEKRVRSDFE
jgi:thermostable 8-oxoguanine DNA glycosylase